VKGPVPWWRDLKHFAAVINIDFLDGNSYQDILKVCKNKYSLQHTDHNLGHCPLYNTTISAQLCISLLHLYMWTAPGDHRTDGGDRKSAKSLQETAEKV